jgi:hypothetical protein
MYVSVIKPSCDLHYIALLHSDDGHVHVYHFLQPTQLMGRILQDRSKGLLWPQDARALMHAMGIVQ